VESSVNLISQSQNTAIPFINRPTSPYAMKTEKKLNQIAEDFSIPEGARPLFIRC
jgi:hypothetical protein